MVAPFRCAETGAVNHTPVLVSLLGTSIYICVEAAWSQGPANWATGHVRSCENFSGVPSDIVPDNLRSGVTKASTHDPWINRGHLDMADCDGATVSLYRPAKPRERAKVECTALQMSSRALSPLQDRIVIRVC